MSNLRMKLMGKRSRLSSDSKSLSSRSEDFDDFSSGRSYRQTSNSSAVLSLEDLEQTTRRISEDTNSFFTLQIERRSSPSDIGSEHASIRNSPASIAPIVDEEDYRRRASAVSANPSFGYDQYYQEHLDALTDSEDEDVFFGWRDNTPRIKADSGASWLMPGDSDHHTFHQAMLDSQTQRDEQLGDLDTRFGRQGHYLKDVMKEDSWSDNGLPSDLASLRHLIV